MGPIISWVSGWNRGSGEKTVEKDGDIDIEAAIDNIETEKNNQEFVNKINNQNCFKNKSENNKENTIQYNNKHINENRKENNKENYDTKHSNRIRSNDCSKDQDKKCENEISEVKRKATNDKASNTWITTMKKETKKARLVIKSEAERKRNDSSSSNGKPTAMEVGFLLQILESLISIDLI